MAGSIEETRAFELESFALRDNGHNFEITEVDQRDTIMRFRSRGVEAFPLTSDLDASLSKTINLQMGTGQAKKTSEWKRCLQLERR